MPSVEHIEEFNASLVEVGNEPAITAQWGEAIEEVRRPESVVDNELSDLLSEAADTDFAGEDIASLIDNFEEEIVEEPTPEESDPLSEISLMDEDFVPPPDASFDDIAPDDLGDLGDLGDEAGDEPVGIEEATADETDFGDLGDLGDLGGDEELGDLGDLGDLGGDKEPAADDVELGDLGDLSGDEELGDFGDLGDLGDEAGDEPAGIGEETADETDFGDLGDLGDLGGDEEFGDLGDLGDLGGDEELGDADDLGDLSDLGGDAELGDLNDLDDLRDEAGDEPAGIEGLAADDADLGNLDDLGDLSGDEEPAADDADLDDLGDLGDLGDEAGDEPAGIEEPAADETDFGDLDDLGDLGGDEELGDLGDLGDMGGDEDLGDLGDIGGDAELGDLNDLDDLRDETGDEPAGIEGLAANDADLGDLGDLGDLDAGEVAAIEESGAGEGELGDLGDLGGGEDLGDLGEGDEDLGEGDEDLGEGDEDLGDLGDLGGLGGIGEADLGDLGALGGDEAIGDLDDEAFGEPGEIDDASAEAAEGGGFEDLGDLDDIDVSDSFGADFADQVAAEFGDSDGLDIDADSLSADPFEGGDDAYDLPAVDESLNEIGDENFSLDDFGEGFDLSEESLEDFAGLEEEGGGAVASEELEDVAGEAPDRDFSDTEFDHIRKTLDSLPLNVKTPVAEIVGNGQGSTEDQNKLIDLLVQGSEPARIAEVASRILDKRIAVPKGYQKRTGLDFEEQTRTFAYRFTNYVLPVLRVAMIVTVVSALVGFLLFRFVYQPIHAQVLYRRGYEDLVAERYVPANETFLRAWELRPRDDWFSRYAEGFVEKRQYDLAVEKYDQLVFGMDPVRRDFLQTKVRQRGLIEMMSDNGVERRVYDALNVDTPAIMDYAALQSEVLANYERADDLYSIILFGDESNYDALLARGDNFTRWAQEDANRHEDARLTFATMLNRYGDTDEILMRFLRYFVRTGNEERVREVVNIFEVMSPGSEVDAEIYAEAAGYLLDNGGYGRVRDMLVRASEAGPAVPEVYYEMARYNRMNEAPVDEEAALDYAKERFEVAEPLDRRRLEMYIDTLVRRGEFELQEGEILTARSEFDLARRRYEEGRRVRYIPQNADLARLYAGLGDIEYYYGGDLDRALELYDRAADEGYVTDSGEYKRGYVHYRRDRFGEAVDHFFEIGATNPFATNRNILYARANTLYKRSNFFAAEAFYRRLLDGLITERDRTANLMVDEDPQHRALVEYLIRVQNNLGVTLFRISEQDVTRTGQFSEALYYLQESAELGENYLRDPDSGVRALARNLAYLNIREILYPSEEFEPQIHSGIPRDPNQVLF